MNLYLESSAVLRDLLDGDQADVIREALRTADTVVTSRLTLAEVARVLVRLRISDPEVAARIAVRESSFVSESELWIVQPVDDDILARCGRPFPAEPVRTLDAIHLATIERISGAVDPLTVVSTDDRVRSNAQRLGFALLP
jgi:predicted nucleic acid-binding protein